MNLKQTIADACQRMEIPLFGVADCARWETPLFLPWVPEPFFPSSIYPEARSVLVIGLPIPLPVLETSPSIWYREMYKTVNALLDQYTYRLAAILTELGYPSVSIPRDGYGSIEVLQKNPVAFFSHRHAAVLAGLGTFGVNNMVLTPAYGPRVRFGSVFTAAEIAPDPLIADQLCIRCNQCVSMCPVGALQEGKYPEDLTDKKACADHSAALNRQYISPCGICIKVCPVGTDRVRYKRTDTRIYTPSGDFDIYHAAWDHVRSYGRKGD
ncbi:MAG TPA: 4Fe-4S binding protein [Methanospirillum sp.]|nr:4Fe-4S binding protein [Methanospirillum sp.]